MRSESCFLRYDNCNQGCQRGILIYPLLNKIKIKNHILPNFGQHFICVPFFGQFLIQMEALLPQFKILNFGKLLYTDSPDCNSLVKITNECHRFRELYLLPYSHDIE